MGTITALWIVGVLVACGGQTSGRPPTPEQEGLDFAVASRKTVDAGSMEFQATYQDFPFGANGSLSFAVDGAAYEVTGNGNGIDFIAVGGDLYAELPEHPGKWSRTRADDVGEGASSWLRAGLYYAGGAGHIGSFAEVDVALPMELVGRDAIADEEVQVYSVQDKGRRAQVGDIWVERVWVDSAGRVKQVRTSDRGKATATVTYGAFGLPVDIRPPAPTDVVEGDLPLEVISEGATTAVTGTERS